MSISMSDTSSATPRETLPVSTTSSTTAVGRASAIRCASLLSSSLLAVAMRFECTLRSRVTASRAKVDVRTHAGQAGPTPVGCSRVSRRVWLGGRLCHVGAAGARSGAAWRNDRAPAARGRPAPNRALRDRVGSYGRVCRVRRLRVCAVEVGSPRGDRPGHGVGDPDLARVRPRGVDRFSRLHAADGPLSRPAAGAADGFVARRAVAAGDRGRRGLERGAGDRAGAGPPLDRPPTRRPPRSRTCRRAGRRAPGATSGRSDPQPIEEFFAAATVERPAGFSLPHRTGRAHEPRERPGAGRRRPAGRR
jgi:hypothetical protein